jgi:hypothetical protein
MKTFLFLFLFCGYYLAGAGFILLVSPKCNFTSITSNEGYALIGGFLSIMGSLLTVIELNEEGKI